MATTHPKTPSPICNGSSRKSKSPAAFTKSSPTNFANTTNPVNITNPKASSTKGTGIHDPIRRLLVGPTSTFVPSTGHCPGSTNGFKTAIVNNGKKRNLINKSSSVSGSSSSSMSCSPVDETNEAINAFRRLENLVSRAAQQKIMGFVGEPPIQHIDANGKRQGLPLPDSSTNDDHFDKICSTVLNHAQFLENRYEEKMNALYCKIRNVVTESFLDTNLRLRLLELLESKEARRELEFDNVNKKGGVMGPKDNIVHVDDNMGLGEMKQISINSDFEKSIKFNGDDKINHYIGDESIAKTNNEICETLSLSNTGSENGKRENFKMEETGIYEASKAIKSSQKLLVNGVENNLPKSVSFAESSPSRLTASSEVCPNSAITINGDTQGLKDGKTVMVNEETNTENENVPVINKYACKDQVYIKASDAGRVMGVKGKRIHQIEEISNTIISFQKDFQNSEREVTICGADEQAINTAKILIEETIRRNVSPCKEFLQTDRDGSRSGIGGKTTPNTNSVFVNKSLSNNSHGTSFNHALIDNTGRSLMHKNFCSNRHHTFVSNGGNFLNGGSPRFFPNNALGLAQRHHVKCCGDPILPLANFPMPFAPINGNVQLSGLDLGGQHCCCCSSSTASNNASMNHMGQQYNLNLPHNFLPPLLPPAIPPPLLRHPTVSPFAGITDDASRYFLQMTRRALGESMPATQNSNNLNNLQGGDRAKSNLITSNLQRVRKYALDDSLLDLSVNSGGLRQPPTYCEHSDACCANHKSNRPPDPYQTCQQVLPNHPIKGTNRERPYQNQHDNRTANSAYHNKLFSCEKSGKGGVGAKAPNMIYYQSMDPGTAAFGNQVSGENVFYPNSKVHPCVPQYFNNGVQNLLHFDQNHNCPQNMVNSMPPPTWNNVSSHGQSNFRNNQTFNGFKQRGRIHQKNIPPSKVRMQNPDSTSVNDEEPLDKNDEVSDKVIPKYTLKIGETIVTLQGKHTEILELAKNVLEKYFEVAKHKEPPGNGSIVLSSETSGQKWMLDSEGGASVSKTQINEFKNLPESILKNLDYAINKDRFDFEGSNQVNRDRKSSNFRRSFSFHQNRYDGGRRPNENPGTGNQFVNGDGGIAYRQSPKHPNRKYSNDAEYQAPLRQNNILKDLILKTYENKNGTDSSSDTGNKELTPPTKKYQVGISKDPQVKPVPKDVTRIAYTRDFMIQLAFSPFSKAVPRDVPRISREAPFLLRLVPENPRRYLKSRTSSFSGSNSICHVPSNKFSSSAVHGIYPSQLMNESVGPGAFFPMPMPTPSMNCLQGPALTLAPGSSSVPPIPSSTTFFKC